MPEQKEAGESQAGAAGQQETGESKTADGQQVTTPAAEGNQDEVAGLKAAAVAEREKRQAIEVENQNLRDQAALDAAKPPQPKVEQEPVFNQIAKSMGFDIDYMTPMEIGQVTAAMVEMKVGQVSQQLNQQSFESSHSDYAEVVGVQVGNTFQYAPPLQRTLNANPALASALKNSPNAGLLAYEIAKNDPQYLADKAEKEKSDDLKAAEKAETITKAANKQLSISAAKGGGQLDQAAAVAAMSDEEFAVHNQKIMDQAK